MISDYNLTVMDMEGKRKEGRKVCRHDGEKDGGKGKADRKGKRKEGINRE